MAIKWLCISENNIAAITAIHSDHVMGSMMSYWWCHKKYPK